MRPHQRRLCLGFVVGWLLVAVASPAAAGRTCESKKIEPDAVQMGFEAGLNVLQRLRSLRGPWGTSPEVVLLGRVGSDLSKHGLRFSHMGFAVRDHPKGPYTVIHLLNHCAEASSDLYIQGLANFFLDDPFAYDALLLVPKADLQRALARRLLSDVPKRLHDPRYNMVAPPRGLGSQNSNQWVLEVLVSALEEADPKSDRRGIHNYPSMDQFQGDIIKIPRWKRLGGVFQAKVDFFDQPLKNRLRSRYEIVTVRAVADWLEAVGGLSFREVISP